MFLYQFTRRHRRLRRRLQAFVHLGCSTWNMEFAFSQSKWLDCQETKSKHIDWSLGPKCDHRIWPWAWPWSWIFKVKYEICYNSVKNGPIATKRKASILIDSRHQMQPLGLTLAMTLTWVFKVKLWNSRIAGIGGPIDIEQKGGIHYHGRDLLVTKRRCKDLPDSGRGDFRCRRAVDSSS